MRCYQSTILNWGLRKYSGDMVQVFADGWRGELGLEPTVGQFIANMVEIFHEVYRVLRHDGQLFLNISDTRTKDRQWCGIPHKLVFALQEDGWRYEDEVIWNKTNPMPGSQTNRFTRSHEFMFMLNKSKDAYFDMDAVREPIAESTASDHRLGWYQAGRPERDYPGGASHGSGLLQPNPNGRNKRTVWTISTQPWHGAHFATFPEALVEPCIKAGTSEHGCCPACGAGWRRVVDKEYVRPATRQSDPAINRDRYKDTHKDGVGYRPDLVLTKSTTTTGWTPGCECGRDDVVPCTILDPFCGSGTSLVVARKLGRRGVGTDLSLPYLREQARARLGLDKLDAWRNGTQEVETKLDDLPMFEVTP